MTKPNTILLIAVSLVLVVIAFIFLRPKGNDRETADLIPRSLNQKYISQQGLEEYLARLRRQVEAGASVTSLFGNPRDFQLFIAAMGIKPDDIVADIGCGTGTNLQSYKKDGCQVFGIDRSPAMVKICRNKLDAIGEIHLGDGANLPFADEVFDFVLSSITCRDGKRKGQYNDEKSPYNHDHHCIGFNLWYRCVCGSQTET